MFVSLGSAAENIEAAVDYLRERRGAKVGSIHLNVFRPFPDAAIVKALAGKKNVIILERTDEPMAGDNPMGRDIRTALNKALQGEEGLPAITADQMPRLFAGVYGLGSRDFRPEHTIGAYEFATGTRARKDGKRASDGASFMVLGVDHPYEVKSDETPSLLPDKAIAVRFHSVGGWGAITTGKNLGAIIGDLNDLLYERDKVVDELGNPKEIIHVSANPKYGSEKKGAPTSYFMVAAPERIRVNCDLRHVTVVLCCDPKAFTHTNPLDGMSEGGCLVWESEEEGEQAWERLPLWARKQIIDKNIRVFTLPGFQDRAQGDRSRRPAAAHAGQRVPRRVLRRLAAAPGIPHHAGAVPRGRPQAVRQEVRPARRRGREVQHGGHDPGVRARARDPGRRARGARSVDAARPGAPAGRRRERRRRRVRIGMPLAPDSRGTGERTPLTRVACSTPSSARPRLRPAGVAAGVARRDGRRQRRHGVEVRRPARNAALHPGELHAVHGVHRRLSGHRAPQLLAGPRHDPADGDHQLRRRRARAAEDAPAHAGDRKARRAR